MVDDTRAGRHRDRRLDILAAAEGEFAALGWSGARIERIARTARVNKQLLFHYYGSKAGLHAAALASLLARYEPPSGPVADPVDDVRRVMRGVEAASRSIPGVLFRVSPPADGDEVPAAATAPVRAWLERGRGRLAEVLTEGQRRGHFRDDLDPDTAAVTGMALALGAGALGGSADAARWMVEHCAWR